MSFRLLFTAIIATTFPLTVGAESVEWRHAKFFDEYEGTSTCLRCHEEEAEAFFNSQHYQWRGETPAIVNTKGESLGKLSMINDFCTNPSGKQWIGKVKNAEGKTLAKGCSTCHAGLGLLPAREVSREQLENIDCLICHNSGYRRDLYATEDGGWEWRPILWENKEGMNAIAQRVSLPTRQMCLRCHSASGGGPNFKRGDLEYILSDPPRKHDVHMASKANDGPDLACIDCHGGDSHRVKGRGVDLAGTDSPGERISCSGSCHGETPHDITALDSHTSRVACTTCHIPKFAKSEPTDMFRDWSNISFSEEKGKYTYSVRRLESDVKPVYAWYNGNSWLQLAGQPVRRDENGIVTMVLPEGSRDDPEARIVGFKVHQSMMPVLNGKDWLLPIHTEEVYADGNVNKAVRDAAREFYGLDDIDFTWTETKRYMGIYHGVVPAREALQCLDCHGPKGRMDWTALGYPGDPMDRIFKTADTGKPGAGNAP
jgi:hypothetical protein